MILADPRQLERILMNLAANARDAMPAGGALTIRTRSDAEGPPPLGREDIPVADRYVIMEVSDTGQGMDPETRERIFEPFFTTKSLGQGTGLGMYTVYGLVKGHGGHVVCRSQLNEGTSFTLYLPAAEGVEAVRASVRDTPPVSAYRGGETILIVDDEKPIQETAREFLAGQGYLVLLADNGEEAVRLYREEGDRIDLVILDLGMPGMGGRACLRELLRLDPGVKVVIASGYSALGQVRDSINAGARDFLGKPYRLLELIKTVRRVLDDESPSGAGENR